MEAELVQLYKERYHFSYIRNYFQNVYPHDKEMFTVQSVKSKVFKILRVSVRKLYYFIANFGADQLPPLINLDDERVKTIVYSKETLDLRIALLNIYTLDYYDKHIVKGTISAIDEYFEAKEAMDELQGRSSRVKDDFRHSRALMPKELGKPKPFYGNKNAKETSRRQ
jgi:hypothetical protein